MNYFATIKDQYDNLSTTARLRLGMAVAAVLVLALLYSTANDQVKKLERKRAAREVDIAEMMQLKLRFQELNAGAQMLANRLASTKPDDSPAKVIEETGIKGKTSQFKPLKGEDHPGYVEDAAEARIDGLSANDSINLIFRLEKGARPIVIKKALIKARFDDPAKLDLTLNLALLKSAPQSGQ